MATRPDTAIVDDLRAFVSRQRRPSRACACGHELFDHLIADGGCYCAFTGVGGVYLPALHPRVSAKEPPALLVTQEQFAQGYREQRGLLVVTRPYTLIRRLPDGHLLVGVPPQSRGTRLLS